jgi:hypothetical protein
MLKKIGSIPLTLAIVLLVAGLPAGVAGALEPIYNVVDHPLPASAQRLSMEEIRRAISISLVATNLAQSGNEIHRKYNQWVRNLEKDIEVRLAVDALTLN